MARVITADLDEMVFKGRNHAYGAYVLRKRYPRAIVTAFIITALILFLLIAAPLVAKLFEGSGEVSENDALKNTVVELGAPPPMDAEVKPPPPPDVKLPPPPKAAQVQFIPPDVVKDIEAKPEQTIANIDTFKKTNVQVGAQDVKGDPNALFVAGDENGTGDAPAEVKEEQAPDPFAFVAVESEPQPVNMAAFKKSLTFPPILRESGMAGKVTIRIFVGKDGKYVKHIILKSTHPAFTKEVESKIKTLSFTPGIQNKKPIPVWVTVPIVFNLE